MGEHFVLDCSETAVGIFYCDFAVFLQEFAQNVAVVGIECAYCEQACKCFFLELCVGVNERCNFLRKVDSFINSYLGSFSFVLFENVS